MYWILNPMNHRKLMYSITIFGAIVGAFLASVDNGSYGVVYYGYFLFVGQISTSPFYNTSNEKMTKILALQMRDQTRIFTTGMILHNLLTMVVYLLLIYLVLGICIPFMGYTPQVFITCTWFVLVFGILSTFQVLASINNHRKEAVGIVLFAFFILSYFLGSRIFDYGIDILSYISNINSLPFLLIMGIVYLPLAYGFGKYCYRTRKEKKYKMLFRSVE